MLSLSRLPTACLLAVVALAGAVHAQTITSYSPQFAAVGTVVEINGSGFGTKPKVQLFDSATGKKYGLKIVDATDTKIHATITKTVLGNLDLQVIVKGAAGPASGPSPISIEAPLVTSLSAASVGPDAVFSINGDFFGTKKGKIKVGTQTGKVVSWTMNEIQVHMPKKLPDGFWPITVDNKLGIDDAATIKMVGSPVKLGKPVIDVKINGVALKGKYAGSVAALGFHAATATNGSQPLKIVSIYFGYDPATQDPGVMLSPANSVLPLLTYVEQPKISSVQDALDPAKQPSIYWATAADPFTFTITSESGGQIGATFTGTLRKQSGVNGADTVPVEGTVIVDG